MRESRGTPLSSDIFTAAPEMWWVSRKGTPYRGWQVADKERAAAQEESTDNDNNHRRSKQIKGINTYLYHYGRKQAWENIGK